MLVAAHSAPISPYAQVEALAHRPSEGGPHSAHQTSHQEGSQKTTLQLLVSS